jgi:hypothetical protein
MRGREGIPHWRRASLATAENRAGGAGGFSAQARERERAGAKGRRETPEFYMDRERGKGKRKGGGGWRPCH